MDPTLFNALRGEEAAQRITGSAYYSMVLLSVVNSAHHAHGQMNWATGAVPCWRCVAQVLESKAPGFVAGQLVIGMTPWREVSAVDPAQFSHVTAQPEAAMSALGMTLTAPHSPSRPHR